MSDFKVFLRGSGRLTYVGKNMLMKFGPTEHKKR